MDISNYSIDEHIHRFAIWTAARAASRGRLKNIEVEYLINESKLKQGVEKLRHERFLDDAYYRNWIKKIGDKMCSVVTYRNWNDFKTGYFCFGLAAKIISIYIKTVEVLPTKGMSLLSEIAYPPIDGILLKNVNSRHHLKLKTKWSTFTWEDYKNVIDELNKHYPLLPKWKIEIEWKVSNEETLVTY